MSPAASDLLHIRLIYFRSFIIFICIFIKFIEVNFTISFSIKIVLIVVNFPSISVKVECCFLTLLFTILIFWFIIGLLIPKFSVWIFCFLLKTCGITSTIMKVILFLILNFKLLINSFSNYLLSFLIFFYFT